MAAIGTAWALLRHDEPACTDAARCARGYRSNKAMDTLSAWLPKQSVPPAARMERIEVAGAAPRRIDIPAATGRWGAPLRTLSFAPQAGRCSLVYQDRNPGQIPLPDPVQQASMPADIPPGRDRLSFVISREGGTLTVSVVAGDPGPCSLRWLP